MSLPILRRKIQLSGVTGTNGKTTTAYLLEQLLRAAGRSTALVGTIEYRIADEVRPAPHTTPESRDLLALLAEGVDRGVTEAVMEVSSHALEQGRVWGIPYDVAIFTNLTQDHLDFHGTMEAYFAAKRKLFDGSQAPPPRVAVLNAEDDTQAALAETSQLGRVCDMELRHSPRRLPCTRYCDAAEWNELPPSCPRTARCRSMLH